MAATSRPQLHTPEHSLTFQIENALERGKEEALRRVLSAQDYLIIVLQAAAVLANRTKLEARKARAA